MKNTRVVLSAVFLALFAYAQADAGTQVVNQDVNSQGLPASSRAKLVRVKAQARHTSASALSNVFITSSIVSSSNPLGSGEFVFNADSSWNPRSVQRCSPPRAPPVS